MISSLVQMYEPIDVHTLLHKFNHINICDLVQMIRACITRNTTRIADEIEVSSEVFLRHFCWVAVHGQDPAAMAGPLYIYAREVTNIDFCMYATSYHASSLVREQPWRENNATPHRQ